jgi:hypothetical protein
MKLVKRAEIPTTMFDRIVELASPAATSATGLAPS